MSGALYASGLLVLRPCTGVPYILGIPPAWRGKHVASRLGFVRVSCGKGQGITAGQEDIVRGENRVDGERSLQVRHEVKGGERRALTFGQAWFAAPPACEAVDAFCIGLGWENGGEHAKT